MTKKRKWDLNIILPVICFFIISIISIKSASSYTSSTLGNLVIKQIIWYVIGLILVKIILHVKNDYLYENTIFLYVTGCLLLLLLLFFGTPINNSRCWFTIPGIGSFQPSEFMKIFLMITLAVMIKNYKYENPNPDLKTEFIFILKTLIILIIPSFLTFMQPDTGAVIMYIVIYLAMMGISGIRARWFILLFSIIIILLAGVLGLYFLKSDEFIKIFGTKMFYRLDRIFAWKNGSGLQLENALAAIGSSGLLGHGFNKTPIYFPESSTDFIFAVFASNFGFIGSLVLILIIFYFDIYIIKMINMKTTSANKYILAGISSCLIFQQIENMGMTIGLFPITGITLPFISYGGSSLLSYMIMLGIILNITSEKEKKYSHK